MASQVLQWTDSIVSSTISTVPDPCGALTHELFDVTSGTPLALNSNVFPASDLISATKSLTVATTDDSLVGTYTI